MNFVINEIIVSKFTQLFTDSPVVIARTKTCALIFSFCTLFVYCFKLFLLLVELIFPENYLICQ